MANRRAIDGHIHARSIENSDLFVECMDASNIGRANIVATVAVAQGGRLNYNLPESVCDKILSGNVETLLGAKPRDLSNTLVREECARHLQHAEKSGVSGQIAQVEKLITAIDGTPQSEQENTHVAELSAQ